MRRVLFVLWVLLWMGPAIVLAQEAEQSTPAQDGIVEVAQSDETVESADALTSFLPDAELQDWALLAGRAEQIVEGGNGSRFALDRVRAELVGWRSKFLIARSQHQDRIVTIDAQIAALGPAQDEGQEFSGVTQRRDALQKQRERLAGPGRLAQEAFARADGLIGELDQQIRARQRTRLLTKSGSPANPDSWPIAAESLKSAIADAIREANVRVDVFRDDGSFLMRLAIFTLSIVGTILALVMCARKSRAVHTPILRTDSKRQTLSKVAVSFVWVIIPIVVLLVGVVILQLSEVVGATGMAVLFALPVAGIIIIVAAWLAGQYFPQNTDDDGILGYAPSTRKRGRWATLGVGWSLAVSVILADLVNTQENVAALIEVILFPVQCAIGYFLWWLGWSIAQRPSSTTKALFIRGRARVIIGRLVQVLAVLGPLAALFGYVAAAQALSVPTVVSLAIFAVLVLLQRLSHAFAGTGKTDGNGEMRATLLPIAINFVLILFSLPILALVWGVSAAQLAELWAQFQVGFSLGETRVSPSNFMTFVFIFVLGYFLTRFIKSSLKITVLPRTKLDLGAQNAVVAGFGYVGIFVSALFAFTMAGIDLSSLAIIGGALSVGIGFGLQNIVSNFVSGIILLIERPIGEGDMIEVGGQMGYVRDISVRSTRIETFDRTDVIVPNADLVSGQVTNWTRGNLVGRVIVQVGVAYGSDTGVVESILQDVAGAHPLVLGNPKPAVLMTGFGADSLDFEIRAIIRDVNYALSVKSELLADINKRFGDAGIEIPFMQRDVWLRNPEALRPDAVEDDT